MLQQQQQQKRMTTRSLLVNFNGSRQNQQQPSSGDQLSSIRINNGNYSSNGNQNSDSINSVTDMKSSIMTKKKKIMIDGEEYKRVLKHHFLE